MTRARVAIIGAGRSGLVAAKYALENGLEPWVFEKASQMGGLWAKDTAIWEGLYSNISIYSMMFSDHPWPKGSSLFASKQEVHDYLTSFAARFNVDKHVHLSTPVHKAVQLENRKWALTYTDLLKSTTETQVFDFLIIASGLHHAPREVTFKSQADFKGRLMHSSKFDFNDPGYVGKKIVVVGFGFSAIDVSVNLIGKAREIVNVFSRPYLVSHRLTTYQVAENSFKIAPIDVFFKHPLFSYGFKEPPNDLTREEIIKIKIDTIKNMFPKQTDKQRVHPALYVDVDDPKQEFLLNFSDSYLECVERNQITPKRAKILELKHDGIVFEDGSFESADVIVLCTGFDLNLEILEEPVVSLLKQENEFNYRLQLVSFKNTFHPDVDNLALINKVEGLTIIGDELQAKWIAKVFSGKIMVDKEKMRDETERIRETIKSSEQSRVQYPYGGGNETCKSLAAELNYDNLSEFDHLKDTDPELYEIFSKKIYPPANYFYQASPEVSVKLAREISEIWKATYEFENADNITSKDFALKFNDKFPYQSNF